MYTDNDFLCDLNEASFDLAIEEFEFNHSQKNTYIAESTSIVMEGTLGNIWEKLKKFLKSIWEFLKKAWNKFIDWLQGKEKEQEEKEKKEENNQGNNKDEDKSSTTVIDNPSGDDKLDEDRYYRYTAKNQGKAPAGVLYRKSSNPKNMEFDEAEYKRSNPNKAIINLTNCETGLDKYVRRMMKMSELFSSIGELMDTYTMQYKKGNTNHSSGKDLETIFGVRDKSQRDKSGLEINTPYIYLQRIANGDADMVYLSKIIFKTVAASANGINGALITIDDKLDKVDLEDIYNNKVSSDSICKDDLSTLEDERKNRKRLMEYTRKVKTKLIDEFDKLLKTIEKGFKRFCSPDFEDVPYISVYVNKVSSMISFISKSSGNVIKALASVISDSIRREKYYKSDEDFHVNEN